MSKVNDLPMAVLTTQALTVAMTPGSGMAGIGQLGTPDAVVPGRTGAGHRMIRSNRHGPRDRMNHTGAA